MSVYILGIESSCDDTGAAIMLDGKILSNVTASQENHAAYGGIVPEVASREHQLHITRVVDKALKEAGIDIQQVNAIAVTQGPGLLGSLLVGVSFAKSVAMALNIPILAIDHMKAHVLAHFIDDPCPKFPFLCLTVSGGHTQIVKVDSPLQMEILGKTIDDAAGEAFDKTGKILGLPYPAGPQIDKLAHLGKAVFSFAEPNIQGLDFSFSGLKTSILYFLQKEMKINPNFITTNLNDICASVQKSIIDILMSKLIKASAQSGIKEIAIAGGVSANKGLRSQLEKTGRELGWNTYIPHISYCTDNAAMIAMAGYFDFQNENFAGLDIAAKARF